MWGHTGSLLDYLNSFPSLSDSVLLLGVKITGSSLDTSAPSQLWVVPELFRASLLLWGNESLKSG